MKVRNEVKAGLFVAATLILFILSIFVIGRERQIFAKQVTYYTSFQDVKGLAEGAPIRLGGITIGRVSVIDFATNMNDPKIHLTLLINDRYAPRIRSDSAVSLETQGLLGDRFLSINAGTSTKTLNPESTLAAKDAGDLTAIYDTAKRLIDKTSSVADDVESIAQQIKAESLPNITEATKSFRNVAKELESGDGILTHLIKDKDGAKTVESLKTSLTKLSDLISGGTSGKGLLYQLFNEESGNKVKEILKSFEEITKNVKAVSTTLADGGGTLGALLVDPSLYNNLVEVTDGAKRSFLLRQAVKSTLKN
jgi:phospholipid/cholesterol/gamma-HCH transport system substrate-binding protein